MRLKVKIKFKWFMPLIFLGVFMLENIGSFQSEVDRKVGIYLKFEIKKSKMVKS